MTATLLPFASAYAQNVFPSHKIAAKTTAAQKAQQAQAKKDFQANHPLLTREKALHPRADFFPTVRHQTFNIPTRAKQSGKLFANASATLWGNLAFKQGWTEDNYGPLGYYAFNPTSPANYTLLYETEAQRPAQNGVQYKDGKIYGLSLDLSYSSYGIIYEYLSTTDTSTGETTKESLDYSSYLNLTAMETAQASDGTVYGEFYNADGSAMEWGTVDYATKTRTTIGPATNTYIALGITSNDQLYGIATDGNLYKIDKSTGAETLVGPTGLTLLDSQSQYYGQSGEIDQKDNTFYWSALDANGNGGLYEVNLTTGAATQIDGEADQVYGMVIPAPAAEDGAPAAVTDLAANFEGTSLTGTITFTAPSKTFAGGVLTGNVDYTVKANGAVIATGTAAADSLVTVNYTAPISGTYNFEVTTSNSVGSSPKAKASKYIGFDQPLAVSNITVSKEDQAVTVSWDAPKGGVHGGTVGALTYDVYRIAGTDTTKVAGDITATTYTDNVPDDGLKTYVYAVRAKAEGLESPLAASNGIVVGSAIEPDWTSTFDTQDEFNLFTVVDGNKDGRSWRYSSYGQYAQSYYSTSTGNDDWLFTPPIHLTPGRLYTVSFVVRNASSKWTNTLEVTWGTDTTAAAQTNTIVSTFAPSDKDTLISVDINPTVDGNYYVGFHDNTQAPNQYYLRLGSVSVTKGAVGTAPRAVTALTVTPAAKGALQATLSFTVPSLNVQGDPIQRVDSFQILRDNVKIATLPSAAAGSVQTYTDNAVPTNGNHSYTVVPYIAGEFGAKASASAFIGQDTPAAPQNTKLNDNVDNILAIWDPFTEVGAKGGYVNPEKLSVSFFTLEQSWLGYDLGDSITTSEPGATRVELPQNPEESVASDGQSQDLYQVAARTNGEGGQSTAVITNGLVVGPSIQLPFKESFKGGNIDNNFAWIDGNDQWANNDESASWSLNTDAADEDGGSVIWHAYSQDNGYWSTDYVITAGDEASFNSPKISLRGATNPKLYFSLYATANDPAQLALQVQTPDGVAHTVKTIDLSATTTAGWTTQELDLSDYASERYVIVKFRGIAQGSATVIGIDNINVFDQLEYNLRAASIDAPASVTAGKSAKVNVKVENYGAHPASNYKVVLYADDKAVDTVTVSDELAVLASNTVSLTLPVAINQTEDIKVKAEVVYANDLDEDDNTTETKSVKVNPSQYTPVNDLTADQNANGVGLSWSAPTAPAPVTKTEDFESYDPWATSFGDWTLVDGDKGLAGGFFQSNTYPGQGTAFAFDIFNPNAITDEFDVIANNPGLKPHSGNQFAGAPYAMDATGESAVDADNWLISPTLSGNAQTITFYALNFAVNGDYGTTVYSENFDVLYSTTDTNPASFTKIESDVADGNVTLDQGANWKQISVQLPAGAKYFAIHHNTPGDNNFLFGIDDVTYEGGAAGASDSIVAYNIYRDGELIGTVDGNSTTFTDATSDEGTHTYNVTIVYEDKAGNRNESGFSNNASVTVTTGIASIQADKDGNYNVYTIDGKTVMLNAKSLNGLKSGLYIINDKKYIVK